MTTRRRSSLAQSVITARRQRGMALVVVLWLVVLLGVMAAGHTRATRTDTLLAARQVEFTRARALAEAGIKHVILELLSDAREAPRPLDGSVFTFDIGGQTVQAAIRDARGLVDLNAAGAGLLEETLLACGAGRQEATELADAILDWRDTDNLAHLNGVEDSGYRAAGLRWGSRDGPFESIDELRYLPGMRQELFERLAPFVTVHSGHGGIRLEYAPPLLVSALDGDTEASASRGTRQVRSGRRNGIYHIYSSAAGADGAVASIEAVVTISSAAATPYSVLDWREPPWAEFPPRRGGGS